MTEEERRLRAPLFFSGAYRVEARQRALSAQQLQEMYNQPATLPDREVMTIENTVAKTAGAFAVLVVFAAAGWMITPAAPWVFWVAAVVGFVLALVNIFKKEPSPALILRAGFAQSPVRPSRSGILPSASRPRKDPIHEFPDPRCGDAWRHAVSRCRTTNV